MARVFKSACANFDGGNNNSRVCAGRALCRRNHAVEPSRISTTRRGTALSSADQASLFSMQPFGRKFT
jgi:hypothetical protein